MLSEDLKNRSGPVALIGMCLILGACGCSTDAAGVVCVEDKDCPTGQYCGPDKRCIPKPDGGQGKDAGVPDSGFDAGFDAGLDTGWNPGEDSGFDAGLDSGSDAGIDASEEDGGTGDSGMDAGNDGGQGDGGTDGGIDGGKKLHQFISTGGGGKVVGNGSNKLMLFVAPTGPSGNVQNGGNQLKLGPASGVGVSK